MAQWVELGGALWVFCAGTGGLAATVAQAMIPLSPATRIFLAPGATDLRKSFEGLSDWVLHQFKEDPLSGHLYVFANRRKNRIKLLYFDGTGVWVCAKRLMGQGCFAWPKTTEPEALRIVAEELTLLLTGIDLEKTRTRPWWRKAA
jgi:transposase